MKSWRSTAACFAPKIAGRCWSTAPRAPGSKRFCCRRSVPVTRCWCRCSAGLVICCARSRVAAGQKCTPSRCRGARSLRRIRLRMRSSACGRACCSPCRAIPPPPCCSRWRSWGRFAVVTMCCSIPTPPRRSAVTRWKPTPGSWTPCPPGCRSAWADLPAPRPSPSARGWKRSSAAAAALSRGSAPMPITMASTR